MPSTDRKGIRGQMLTAPRRVLQAPAWGVSYRDLRKATSAARSAGGRALKRSRAPAPSPPCSSIACSSVRSEEHTSELQSRLHLVCRLLLEKKKKNNKAQLQ